jgi:hypothetical protein
MHAWLKRIGAGIVLVSATAMAQTAPSSESWGAWYYRTPPGWHAEGTPAALVLVPEQSNPLNKMWLLPPEPMQGSLPDWFQNVTQREVRVYKNYHLNAMQQGTTMHGKAKVFCTGQGITQDGQQVVISYMGLMSLDGQGLLLETQFETMSSFRYLGAYAQFVKSIEPGSAPKAAEEHPAKKTQPAHESNSPSQGGKHKHESDQTNQPGGSGPAGSQPLAQPSQPKEL